MEGNKFAFCPQCGSRRIETKMNGRKWQCPDCGFDLYSNVASAVGVIIQNEAGEVLFEKRAKEPRKGFCVVPGGFTNSDETGEAAAVRECAEETGVIAQKIHYLCSFPNTYEYKEIMYKTCDMFFTAEFPRGVLLTAQQSEVSSLFWQKIESIDDLERIPLAFDSTKNALLKWLEEKSK